MDFFSSNFFSGLAAVILIDLVLAGDNAIVIALAARNLPRNLQKKAIFWGVFGAIGVRFAMTAVVVLLLRLPGLMLLGGLLLLPIGWKLLRQNDADPKISSGNNFWSAMRTIVVADALMGLDNVLAIAGASHGHMSLVIIGLLVSVPLIVYGSTLILKLIERFPIIVYIGAGIIAWTSGRMMTHDRLLRPWFAQYPWTGYSLEILLVAGLCGLGWWSQHRTHTDNE